MKFQLWAKTVDKVWCYWEQLGETHQGGKMLGKPLGTRLGTWWEHQNPKKMTPPPFLPQKGKKGLWEHIGNRLGTWWEHQNPKKITPPPSPPSLPHMKKIWTPLGAC